MFRLNYIKYFIFNICFSALSNDLDSVKSDLQQEIAGVKGDVNTIFDNGQLLTITQLTLLHPTGDGTVSVDGEGFSYTRNTAISNILGFSFIGVSGQEYTASFKLSSDIDLGSIQMYAVKGTTFSSTTYLGKTSSISEKGTYSFTFTAITETTTIWFYIKYGVSKITVNNIICSAGWGYNGLDSLLTSNNRPAPAKTVGMIGDNVTSFGDKVNKMLINNNLITINNQSIMHTTGTATISYDYTNGFSTNNTGIDNNLIGFCVDTFAQKEYRLKLKIQKGPVLSIYLCKSDSYNSENYIEKRSALSDNDELDIIFTAVTDKTSVWFNQKYNVTSIAVSDIFFGDDILRYNKYIMDYDGSEITVFNKILCIGDSITEGTFNYSSGGSNNNVIADRRYSYPMYLQKLTGSEITNYGYGGDTAEEWYSRYQNTDLSGYDACIIMLGINDGVENVGVSSFRTGMTNIINKVMSENNGIKVFVATIVPCYSDYDRKFDGYIAEAKRLVEEDFTDAFLIDINKYSICKLKSYYAQGHLTAIGYQQLAKEFYTLISYVIHNNTQAFRNVQFIGTNYTYPDYAEE